MTNEPKAPERIWAQPPTTFDEYDVWTAYPSGEAIEYTCADLVATATLPISDAEERIEELEAKLAKAIGALKFVSGQVSWEINPSNYTNQEVCDMNADWCEVGNYVDATIAEIQGQPPE